MITRILRPTDIAALVAGTPTSAFEARVPDDKKSWATLVNLTNWIFELLDDQNSIREVILPGRTPVTLRVRTEKLFLNPVAQLANGAIPVATANQVVYLEVTDSEPPAASPDLLPILGGTSTGQPSVVQILDATGAVLISAVGSAAADGQGAGNQLMIAGFNRLFNGATWDRVRSASNANLIAESGLGAALVAPPGFWAVASTPAAGTQASASRAAGGAGIRHVATGALFSWGAIAAPVATLLQANLRDGATGAGTVLEAAQLAVPAAVFQGAPIPINCNDPGSAATAMTAEASALLANLAEGASLTGYDGAP